MKDKKNYWTLLPLLTICLLAAAQVGAQNVSVSGMVMDNTGAPISGAIVAVKGTSQGTTSNTDGTFILSNVPAAGELQVSFLGYKNQEVAVRGNRTLRIVLEKTEQALQEIVVVGYGVQRKEDLTGSVGQVNISDMIKAPVGTFDQAMAGRIAGVSVTTSDGQPGEASEFVIRGGNSLTQSSQPLYVVDGFPMENYAQAAISPQDIQSISILKDASSTAIYGARGANGVVVIETKKGSVGKPTVSYSGSIGFQQVTNKMELMNAREFVEYQYELNPTLANSYYLADQGLTFESYDNAAVYDWQGQLFRTALIHMHDVAIRGGNQDTKYSISGSIFDQDGIIINSGYERYSGRISLDQNISKKVKVGVVVGIAQTSTHGTPVARGDQAINNSSGYVLAQTWAFSPATIGNQYIDWENEFIDPTAPAGNFRVNPIQNAQEVLNTNKYSDVNTNAYFSYQIIPGLTLKITGGFNQRKNQQAFLYNSKTLYGTPLNPSNTKGTWGGITHRSSNTWLNESTLSYNKRFAKKHVINALGGFTIQESKGDSYRLEAEKIPNEDLGLASLGSGTPSTNQTSASFNRLVSFLTRVNYSYDQKYLLTASFRADGSSKFPRNNLWGYFPAVGLGWRVSEERFLKESKYVSNLKIRASYGVTGNNRIGDFAYYAAVSTGDSYGYVFNDGILSKGSKSTSIGNSQLKWESTEQIDVGIEIGLFRNRLGMEVDLYRKNTRDLLLNATLPRYSGHTKMMQNIGEIRNQGLEITVNAIPVQTETFRWESSFNISFNATKILKLSRGETLLTSAVSWENNYKNPLYLAQVGGPAAVFIGFVHEGNYQYEDFDELSSGIWVLKETIPTNGNSRDRIQPGDIKYRDINGDGTINISDATIIGDPNPIHFGGFTNRFAYKNVSLNVLLQWSYGNDVFNANRASFEGNYLNRMNTNQFKSNVNRWTPENQTNDIPRAGGQPPYGSYDSRTIEDASFLRIKTVDLEYSLPKRWISKVQLSNVIVNVSCQNLFTFTGYKGMDPEVSTRHSALTPGFDYAAYPRGRTIVFGIRLTY